MKKIGIITFHCAGNFGAVLQAYGLRECLKSLDCNVDIINYTPSSLRNPYKLLPDHATIQRYMQSGLKYTLKNLVWDRMKTSRQRIQKLSAFQSFRKQHLEITFRPIRKITLQNAPKYDVYITGSDQVWNPECTAGIDKTFYLDFVGEKTIRASYAASTGGNSLEAQKEEIGKLVAPLDFISIREKSSQNLIEEISGRKVEIVIDPVFLIPTQKWLSLIDPKPRFSGKYIFFYCIDNNPKAICYANWLSENYQLPIVHFYFGTLRQQIHIDGKCFYFEGPIDFLWYIQNAEYIVTSSFHCVAFSLIFRKKFYPFLYPGRGARVTDLLNDLGLGDRINRSPDTDIPSTIDDRIDYETVHCRLKSMSEHGIRYLQKIITAKGGTSHEQ